MMSFSRILSSLFGAALIAGVSAAATAVAASGAFGDGSLETVGYWRFEPDAFTADSSGNGFDLRNAGAKKASTDASFFPNAVPATGARNAGYAALEGEGHLRHEDVPAFSLQDFTVEAYVSVGPGFGVIASSADWLESAADRGWRFGLNRYASQLILQLSPDGKTMRRFIAEFPLKSARHYYVAAAVDVDPVDGTVVRLDARDLENAGELLTRRFEAPELTSIHDSSAPFVIGATYLSNGNFGNVWSGGVDELRLSRGAREPNELLDAGRADARPDSSETGNEADTTEEATQEPSYGRLNP